MKGKGRERGGRERGRFGGREDGGNGAQMGGVEGAWCTERGNERAGCGEEVECEGKDGAGSGRQA